MNEIIIKRMGGVEMTQTISVLLKRKKGKVIFYFHTEMNRILVLYAAKCSNIFSILHFKKPDFIINIVDVGNI